MAGYQSRIEAGSPAGGPAAQATPPAAPVTLFDGKSLDGWRKLGTANWHIVEDYVEASSGTGFLVTPNAYGNFHLTAEFWTDADANSGIFIRCSNPNEVTAASAYEVNIFDKRPDPQYRTGAIVNVASPKARLDAAGKWNTFEITAEGSRLVVRMNGTLMVDVMDTKFASGPIALQYGAGIVRFRNVKITPR
ncbi:MAG: hypothetical protein A3H28_02365 [Acidobacteria bacterium RIFCSPLOWO2_02_FULL_61_28]|nr:MAG: hypothetical protein A3H28_02365 [Acidobacteria bacterium RIFCSPLOWO2_02_FULL_61_28]